MSSSGIGKLPENTTNYTIIREAVNEIIKFASFASAKELIDVTTAAVNVGTSGTGFSAESSTICELLLGSTEAIPHNDQLKQELDTINASAQNQGLTSGLVYSSMQPYSQANYGAPLTSKVISLVYHEANSKVDYSSVLSDVCAVFCNLVPPVELALCVPHFDVKIIYPKDQTGYSRLSTLKFVGATPPTDTSQGPAQVGLDTKAGYDVAGMEIFCLPQTIAASNDFLRSTSQIAERGFPVLDPLVPLLTLESANIQQIGINGSLYAQTKVDLKLVLHDRSRLGDIEPLVSPEIFPNTSFQITYGWSHPDTNKMSGNIFAKMINAMKVTQSFLLNSVSLSARDASSMSINLTLISQGSMVAKGAKAITGNDLYLPYSLIQNLIDRFTRLKTKSSDADGIPTWSSVGSTIVANTSGGASSSKFIPIAAFYELYNYLEQVFETGSTVNEQTIKDVAEKLTILDYLVTDSLPSDSFQQLFIFENDDGDTSYGSLSDPPLFSTPANPNQSFFNTYLTAKVKEVAEKANLITVAAEGEKAETNRAPVVPLAALLQRLVAKPLLASIPDLDEVRIHCFSFNSSCGYMADENIGNFPIAIKDLVDFDTNEKGEQRATSKFNIKTSAETAISLLVSLVNDPSSVFYGHATEMQKQEAAAQKFAEATGQEAEAAEATYNAAIKDSKKSIDTINETILRDKAQQANKSFSLVDSSFVPPRVKSQIDVLPSYGKNGVGDSKANPAGKIARIIVYDERCGGFNKLGNLIFSMINANGIARISGGVNPTQSVKEASSSIQGQVKELFSQISSEPIISADGTDTGQKAQTYIIKDKQAARQIASTLYPSLVVGTEGSGIISATYTSQPAGDVGSSYFLTALQGGSSNVVGGKSSDPGLVDDVMIIPSSVNLSMIGNTCITRGQTYYIDFNTGTTLDNSYTVTSVSHSFRPGEFKTSATLQHTNSASMRSISRQLQELIIRVKKDSGIDSNPSKSAVTNK